MRSCVHHSMWIHCSTDFRLRLRVVYLREASDGDRWLAHDLCCNRMHSCCSSTVFYVTSIEGGIIAELFKTTKGGGNLGGTVQNDKVRGTDFGLEL